jgi:hypothetical protein
MLVLKELRMKSDPPDIAALLKTLDRLKSPLNLEGLIQDLRSRAADINHAIACLERLVSPLPANGTSRNRSGRKGMPPEERQQVSQRMEDYWARRKQGTGGQR